MLPVSHDRPPATIEALAEFPATEAMSVAAWDAVLAQVRRCHPPTAELSNFTPGLWLGGDEIRLSRLADLVLVDIFDVEPATIVITLDAGTEIDAHVAEQLVEISRSRPLRFLTQPTADALGPAFAGLGVEIRPVRDDADYLLSMQRLALMDGPEYSSKRRAVGRLERRHVVAVREGRLSEAWAQEHVARSFARWQAAKFGDRRVPDFVGLERAGIAAWPAEILDRMLVFGLMVDGEAAGVSLIEPMWSGTWMGVVLKADPTVPGAIPFLRRHVARAGLAAVGPGGVINVQQDDGEPGLRAAKLSYAPARMEPKFHVGRPIGKAS